MANPTTDPTTENALLKERHIALRRALERLHRSATIACEYVDERDNSGDAQALVNALQEDLDQADEALNEYP